MLKGHNYGICRLCGKNHGVSPLIGVDKSHKWTEDEKRRHSEIFMGHPVSKETGRKISESKKGKSWKESMGTERANKLKENFSTRMKGKKRTDLKDRSYYKTKEYKEMMSKALKKKRESDPEYCKRVASALHTSPNNLEKRIITIMKNFNLPFKFVGDGHTFINGLNPDFIDFKGKKIVEIFGDYWHEKSDEYNRTKHFSKYGYNTLVLWESTIKDISDTEIAEFIGGM